MKVLAIIPARGGSKGIPRKNLRPLAGKPLIYYSIRACLQANTVHRVVVSTDDDEIALFAKRFGAEVFMRPKELGTDAVTLDPVIAQAAEQIESMWHEQYDVILTIQPTSPLLKSDDIDNALMQFDSDAVDTVLSVVDDRHLCWTIKNDRPIPSYTARLNRQQLPPNFKETGAIIACRREQLAKGSRIGNNIKLFVMPAERSFDIDTTTDLYLCESILNHKRIVFTVVGRNELGLGHAYRAVCLAHELVKFDLHFVCEEKDDLAYAHISKQNYTVHSCEDGQLLKTVLDLDPDLVINDILDTESEYIKALKNHELKVINFEDMGSGYHHADLVVNALYPHQTALDHVLIGSKFFCLRDEFLYLSPTEKQSDVQRILITFGGVDEENLSVRILQLIAGTCIDRKIAIDIVVGPGYAYKKHLTELVEQYNTDKIQYVPATTRISDFMMQADLAITSGGRTVFELAAIKIPTMVICQNERETTHNFASDNNGVCNLGLYRNVSDQQIISTFQTLTTDQNIRLTMKKKMEQLDLTRGKKRVINHITSLLQG